MYVECEEEIKLEEAREALENAPGIVVLDRPEEQAYAMPVDCAGEDSVYVSRLRRDPTVPHGLAMWVVSDNLRKGAATNAVQIAETLVETDRKSVVEGKGVSVRVDPGCRRNIKQKNNHITKKNKD